MPNTLPSLEAFYPLFTKGAKVLFILGVAWLCARIVSRLVFKLNLYALRVMDEKDGGSRLELEKRARTISQVVGRAAMLAIWFSAAIMALREGFGIEATPLIASAGVVGLAVGFGAQNLVRDVITGLFMLLENQIRINDVVVINGTGGLVEEMNLRTTVLRALDGTVHIFPNGNIQSLSNMTREFSYYVFDVRVAYKEDTDRVIEVLKEIAEEMRRDEQYGPSILEPLDVLGVDMFTDSGVIVKARIKTLPIHQWAVGREMNRRIKKRFDQLGITMSVPYRALYLGDKDRWLHLDLSGPQREQLRQIIREVMEEMGAAKTVSGSKGS